MTTSTKTKTKPVKAMGITPYDFLCALDPGNRGINGISYKGDGTCANTTFTASVRMQIDPDYMNAPEMKPLFRRTDLYHWNGRTYIFGDDVVHFPHGTIERNQGNRRYGEDAHQFYVAAALLNMGVSGDIDITLGLPPKSYNALKDGVIAAYENRTVHIAVDTADGQHYESVINYAKVRVLPEGSGVVFCNGYRANGTRNADLTRYMIGHVGVIDFGGNTTDIWRMVNGLFDPTAITTLPDTGSEHELIQPLLRALSKVKPDYAYILPEQLDYAIRSGTFLVAAPNGESVNIRKTYDKLMAAWADRVATEIIQPHFKSMEGINGLHLIGGPAKGLRPYLAAKYPGKIFDREAVDNIDETEVNAHGWMRYMLHNHFHKAATK